MQGKSQVKALATKPPITTPQACGASIVTHSGRLFDPVAGTGPLAIDDIAHALSNICRFGGHTGEFYSVAEHSVRVAQILPTHHALWGLVHDAAEAYLGDIVRPIKRQPCVRGLVEAEGRILIRLTHSLGLSWPMPSEVVEADEILLATEWRDLMFDSPHWRPTHRPLMGKIEPWAPRQAKQAWLAAFTRLQPEAAIQADHE